MLRELFHFSEQTNRRREKIHAKDRHLSELRGCAVSIGGGKEKRKTGLKFRTRYRKQIAGGWFWGGKEGRCLKGFSNFGLETENREQATLPLRIKKKQVLGLVSPRSNTGGDEEDGGGNENPPTPRNAKRILIPPPRTFREKKSKWLS